MLRNLAKNEVSKFLRFVAEIEDPAVFANDPQLLLADVNDQLSSQDRVVARGHDAHLKKRWRIKRWSLTI